MKKFFCLVIIFALITIFLPTAHAGLDYKVNVKVNGEMIDFPDQKPFMDTSAQRTFVPLRFVSEALGCEVEWDGKSQTAIVDRAGTFIEMKIDSSKPIVNNESKTLDAPARLMNGRTMVPLRFVSEAIGAYVDWDSKTRTVIITDLDVTGEVTDPANDDNSRGNNNITGGTIIKVEDGGGGTSTKPADDTPPTPWGI